MRQAFARQDKIERRDEIGSGIDQRAVEIAFCALLLRRNQEGQLDIHRRAMLTIVFVFSNVRSKPQRTRREHGCPASLHPKNENYHHFLLAE
jgi:hypothetical protein